MEDNNSVLGSNFSNVSTTLLITLHARAFESMSKDHLLTDPKAEEIVKKLQVDLSHSSNPLFRKFAKGKMNKLLQASMALRARFFDRKTTTFLQNNPAGTVVNLGCGLDTRFWRIDNGSCRFFDLDLPEVMDVKKQLVSESERYSFISQSVLDFSWMDKAAKQKGPFMFLAEGLFMYLQPEDVKKLVIELHSRFPGSELVCEVANAKWTKGIWKAMVGIKFQKQMHLPKGVTFNFGLYRSNEMESWAQGIKFLDEWCYFDEDEKKLGIIRWFKNMKSVRYTQWSVHYRL